MNSCQKIAFDSVIYGNNVFITGPPGTGKTYVLGHIINHCKSEGVKIGVTGTTGCAAVLINGTTIHSFLKIGLAKDDPTMLANKARMRHAADIEKLRALEILIIDEISMLNSETFQKISEYLSIIRRNINPFGGLQVIFVGDFYQLPPVFGEFCFENPVWKELNLINIQLKTQVRQSGDLEFQELLGRAREGKVTNKDINRLKECTELDIEGDVIPTKLFALNKSADAINISNFKKIEKTNTSISYRSGKDSKDKVTLCKGCQIMITRNIDIEQGLVNGSRGIVINIKKNSVTVKLLNNTICHIGYADVKDDETNKILYRVMPIKLAWATSIHKSQGATINYLELDLGRSIFADGQAYTALSRTISLNNVKILNIKTRSFKTNPKVIEFYDNL